MYHGPGSQWLNHSAQPKACVTLGKFPHLSVTWFLILQEGVVTVTYAE